MSFHGVHQPDAFTRMSDIIVQENCARGKCLPAGFFQGLHDGRCTGKEIDEFIAEGMEYLISWTDLTTQV